MGTTDPLLFATIPREDVIKDINIIEFFGFNVNINEMQIIP